MTKSTFVIVPLSVIGLSASYSAANEWCGDAHIISGKRVMKITVAQIRFMRRSIAQSSISGQSTKEGVAGRRKFGEAHLNAADWVAAHAVT